MMSVADWRKRALDCLEAARLSSDQNGQLGWRSLADAWLQSAEWGERERLAGRSDEMRVVGPVTVAPAVASGERLRRILALRK
jgi:hypothetical protein